MQVLVHSVTAAASAATVERAAIGSLVALRLLRCASRRTALTMATGSFFRRLPHSDISGHMTVFDGWGWGPSRTLVARARHLLEEAAAEEAMGGGGRPSEGGIRCRGGYIFALQQFGLATTPAVRTCPC